MKNLCFSYLLPKSGSRSYEWLFFMLQKRIRPQEITALTGINRKTIYNIYYDKTKGITYENLNKLCYALDCTPNDILKYTPDKK